MKFPLNTKTDFLFQLFIWFFSPELICDIGSLDGESSLLLRKIAHNAKIIAFEANPENYNEMRSNEKLISNRIEIENKAVLNKEGIIKFFIEKTSKKESYRKGISSTKQRVNNSLGHKEISVESTRLDTFIRKLKIKPNSVALWIDVEGASYEVLETIENIKNIINFIHVEVETIPIWRDQKLKHDIEMLMRKFDFIIIAEGDNRNIQHDLVFLNRDFYIQNSLSIKIIILIGLLITAIKKKFGKRFNIIKNAIIKLIQF